MAEGGSVTNLGELAKPATVLVERISDGFEGAFKPFQIKRVAKAEAEARIIKARGELEVSDIQRRAVARFVAEEVQTQANMESITVKAIPQLEESATPENVDKDWLTNFFDKSRITSDDEMQELWAKVLAGEANAPGSYAKRTVNLIGALDKRDAEVFTALCGFGWKLGDITPVVLDAADAIYNAKGITFKTLTHLDDIGLASFTSLVNLQQTGLGPSVLIHYYGTPVGLHFKKAEGNDLNIGGVLLTQAGKELAPICGSKPVAGFLEYVTERWVKKGVAVSSPYPRRGVGSG